MQGRYADDLAILWIAGQESNEGTSVWLPYELVHTDYTLPLPQGSGCFAANTNGLASGNHRLEAISHGLAEVIIGKQRHGLDHRGTKGGRCAPRQG